MIAPIPELSKRDLIKETTSGLEELSPDGKVTLYAGFDPTADSLHVGNLALIMALSHFQQAGHKVLVVVGGATGMVGDPSGKSQERNLLGKEEVARNAECIKKQLSCFLDFDGENPALLLNNDDWIGSMSFIDWLREVGKHFTVNSMIAKKSVASRLNSPDGISFTEFSYMTMQAYDFFHLFTSYNCTVQIGGQDQYGNITAGIELIRKKAAGRAYGLTIPLITTASGKKFGKSEGNAVWLDPKKTSVFDFYQFWLNTSDSDVRRFLHIFTFLDRTFIEEIMAEHKKRPEDRTAQRLLAHEVTSLVHGAKNAISARRLSEFLFGNNTSVSLRVDEVENLLPNMVVSRFNLSECGIDGVDVMSLVRKTGILKSNSEARRLIRQGGLYINNLRVSSEDELIRPWCAQRGRLLVVGIGKKKRHLVQFV